MRIGTVTLEREYGGETLSLQLSKPPAGELLDYFDSIKRAKNDRDGLAIAQKFAIKTIVSWNVEDNDGKPIEVKDFKQLPIDLQALIFKGIAGVLIDIPLVKGRPFESSSSQEG